MYIDGDGSIYSQGKEDFQVSARLLLRGVPRTIVRNLFIVPILVRSNQITINDVTKGSAAVNLTRQNHTVIFFINNFLLYICISIYISKFLGDHSSNGYAFTSIYT